MLTKPVLSKTAITALREWASQHNDEALLADGLEAAFIGMATRGPKAALAVYDIAKCIDILMQRDGMTYDDAEEFLSFNTLNTWMGDNTPLFLRRYEAEDT